MQADLGITGVHRRRHCSARPVRKRAQGEMCRRPCVDTGAADGEGGGKLGLLYCQWVKMLTN